MIENEILDYEETEPVYKVHGWIRYIGCLRAIVTVKYAGLLVFFVLGLMRFVLTLNFGVGKIFIVVFVIPLAMMVYYNIKQAYREISLDVTCYEDHYLRGLSILYFFGTLIVMIVTFFNIDILQPAEYRYIHQYIKAILIPIYLVLIIMEVIYMKKPYVSYN